MKNKLYLLIAILCVCFFIQADITFFEKVGKFDRVGSVSILHKLMLSEFITELALIKLLLSLCTFFWLLYALLKGKLLPGFFFVSFSCGMVQVFTAWLSTTAIIGILQQVSGRPISFLDFELMFSEAAQPMWQVFIPAYLGLFIYLFLCIALPATFKPDNKARQNRPAGWTR